MVVAADLVDLHNATQSRRVFWDEEIYNQEIERIFGRAWLFLTHESLIPKPGDFITTKMAEDDVIVARQQDGSLRAFLNTCNHRGAKVCHADSGNTKAFVCSYHGWVYGQDGSLADVPLEHRCYHDALDKSELGLRQIRVESYRGFVFGCFDKSAPDLQGWLGEFAWYIDSFMVGAGEGAELLGPPLKSTLDCNWKVPCENFIGDGYHVGWTHAAAIQMIGGPLAPMAGNRADMPFDDLGMQITTRHGHGFGIIDNAAAALHPSGLWYQYLEQTRGDVRRLLGPERERLYVGHWNSAFFPNCTFLYGTNTFKVWHPRGPHQLEVWTYTLVPKAAPDELKRDIQRMAIRTFGTAGIFESDDGENMMTCTYSNRGRVTRQGKMRFDMGVNFEGPHPAYPGILGSSFIGETSYRGFYRFWAEMMDAPSWDAIRQNDRSWDSMWTNRNFWKDRLQAA